MTGPVHRIALYPIPEAAGRPGAGEVTPAGAAPGTLDGELVVGDVPPWALELRAGGRSWSATGADLFDSLSALRVALAADGLLPGVAGARADVWPSGMSRQMAGGRRAYLHPAGSRAGHRPGPGDLVDIFDPAPAEAVVTVDQQLAAVRSRFDGG